MQLNNKTMQSIDTLIRYNSWQFVVMMIFVLFMGAGTSFTVSDSPLVNIPGFLVIIGITFFLTRKIIRYLYIKQLSILLLVVGLWIFIQCFRVGHYDFAYVMLFLHIIIAYLIILVYGKEFFVYYERVIFLLVVIGLLGWVINNVIGTPSMSALAPFRSSDYNNALEESGSFLIYVTGAWKSAQDLPIELYRNQGFCWEAGRYASLVAVGLVVYLIKSNHKFNIASPKLWIYVITILSTFSTTGYIALLIIAVITILFVYRTNLFLKGLIAIGLCYVGLSIGSLNFINEKIEEQSDMSTFFSETGHITKEGVVTVERFEGNYLDWLNFIHDPILGYGLTDQWSYVQTHISNQLITSNGLMKPFAQYGFLLAFLYFVFLYRSSRLLLSDYNYEFKPMLFLVIITISFSYDFGKHPIFLAFTLYDIFYPYKMDCR